MSQGYVRFRKYQLLRGNPAKTFKFDPAVRIGVGCLRMAPGAAMSELKDE